ncbi:MAG: hypothetical protein JRG69_11390 [Deltaproteobacteria bacterium]|nr:hypothetical protein [Deltaproteobacteria bacterium]
MGSYDLYGGMPPHQKMDTSVAAARAVEGDVGRLQAAVLRYIQGCGDDGATDDELEVQLGLSHQSVSARRRELVLKGKVRDSGRRRLTRRNRKAAVWVEGFEIDIDEGGGRAATPTPSLQVMRKAYEDVVAMQTVAKEAGFMFQHKEESVGFAVWLRSAAGIKK